jgi:arylsulfatase A-like enzyme
MVPIRFFCISLLLCIGNIWHSNAQLHSKNTPPNVIIILTDDMGYGELSCYNPKQVATPHIDRLAKEGARFTNFYVPTPYCAPSRASLLTGRFPLRHGVLENPAPDSNINEVGLPKQEVTLGEMFQKAGYATQCIGKWHLGHQPEFHPLLHGFDGYYGMLYSNDMRPVQLIENHTIVSTTVDQNWLTQDYTHKAIEFINAHQNTPFFLYLAHAMPHKPLAASGAFYKDGNSKELYESVLKELDWSTGAIIERLEKLNLFNNTIVIFMSDNGPWFGGNTGGLKGMKANNWEGGIRVPFMMRYPKAVQKGSIATTPCWSLDIVPTLQHLTTLQQDPKIKLDGQNISAILKGKKQDHDPIFSMKDHKIKTIRVGKWKMYLSTPDFYQEIDLKKYSDPRKPDGISIIAPLQQASPEAYPGLKPRRMPGESFLFDLENDPYESINLADKHPEIIKELLEKAALFQNTLPL